VTIKLKKLIESKEYLENTKILLKAATAHYNELKTDYEKEIENSVLLKTRYKKEMQKVIDFWEKHKY